MLVHLGRVLYTDIYMQPLAPHPVCLSICTPSTREFDIQS